MAASHESCTEDQRDGGSLYTKHVPCEAPYEFTQYAADYKVLLHGAVALKALANNVAGEQTHHEAGFRNMNDLIFRFCGSETGPKKVLLLQSHYREGYRDLNEADLGSGYDDALSLDGYFQAFVECKRSLLDRGENLQNVVLFTNRGVSPDLESRFAEIAKENLEHPLKELLGIDDCDSQKFYKFLHPDSYDMGSFYPKPLLCHEHVQWWLKRTDDQLKGLKLEFLKSLVIAARQPDTEQLLKIQRVALSGLQVCENISEPDRDLILQVFHDSVRSWMQAKDGEKVRSWTSKRTERCLEEAKAKVMLSLETGPDGGPVTEHLEHILVAATLTGHARAVEVLLGKGGNVNATWRNGRTLLHVATYRGYTDVVKVLLAKPGCDVDAVDRRNRAAIDIAVSKGLIAIAALLLDRGCNANLGVWPGEKPLHLAAKEGQLDMVELLLDKGCDRNAVTDTGKTALHLAVRGGHRDVAELLLQRGCDVNAESRDGNALYDAAEGGHLDMVQWLLEMGCRADGTSSRRESPLHVAARAGRGDIVQFLLDNGCEADVDVPNYETPLGLAAFHGYADVVKLLLEHGCDGGTAILSAACAGNVAILKMLASHGADPNAKRLDGFTAMHWAAMRGKMEVVEYLLQLNCDADAAFENGVRPLHLAARDGHTDIARLLIGHGCSLDAATNFEEQWPLSDPLGQSGMTALHYAASEGRLDVAELLLDRGCDANLADAKGRTALHHAARRGDAAMGALLLRHGCRVDARDADGRPALHLVANDESLAFATLLLDNGADVNLSDAKGRTALHCAALRRRRRSWRGSLKTVQMLLARGCNVNAKTAKGRTALHEAASHGPGFKAGGAKQHVAAAALLLDHGCDVKAVDADGCTALYVAITKRTHCIVKLLQERGCGMTADEKKAVEDAVRGTASGAKKDDSSTEELEAPRS